MTGQKNGSGLHILVLGEDTLCREGLCRLLQDLPCPVDIDREDGVAEMDGLPKQEAFDLIFLCLLPPGADLGAAVRAVKTTAGRTPVGVIGLLDTPAAVRSAIGAGASGYLPAVSSPRVVLHAAELMLSGGVYLPPSVLGNGNAHAQPREPTDPGQVRLTRRQKAVLRELAKGQSNKQIAAALGLSEATVKVHIAAIMKSLKAQNRTHAVLTATQAGILTEGVG
jgi:DNA-binding NarL/FixJ family response regulator